jgi:hypothetical protein
LANHQLPNPGTKHSILLAGKTHGPSSTAVGEGLKTAFAGHEAEFIIEARDIIGNQRVVGDDAFHVEVEGPSNPQVRYDLFEYAYIYILDFICMQTCIGK